ncbi:DUF2786 domain-containing protein [Kitasatospora sp. NBC_01287]|uniref:DUF2786 domain-containing protein n=1 Tax=Kitasatospora sp. NBC_01287 TaxID=2903573 RepID=UPI002251B672|nr:DUF2786 domain-containing protein [Kitasatospora sp. NBC_01287]MCX4748460.1 DUF2786 domain-containing protein [Kitasatospora sp. NBC_01287]
MGSVDEERKSIDELLERALGAVLGAPDRRVDEAVDGAASLLAASDQCWPAVSRGALALADRSLGGLWARGWRPADLARLVRRDLSPVHQALLVDLVAAEARRYAPAALDRRWQEQLRELAAAVWWVADEEFLPGFAQTHRLDRFALASALLELLRMLGRLPALAPVGPAPGARPVEHRAAVPVPGEPRMLGRIRALLAKAESTEFPQEAEALTGKAQQLMAQHSIDEALLAAGQADDSRPGAVRIGVENPYEGPKAMLLDAVAAANRCRVVWAKEFGFCTVVGFDPDLDAVELLYTSLLVQATAAMNRSGSKQHVDGASRTRAFRQSFLVSYAARIRERLTAATERTTREAAAGRHLREDGSAEQLVPDERLLPALAAREQAVGSATDRMFPKLTSQRVRVSDGEGWAAGRAAADRAALHERARVGRGRGKR